MQRGFLRGLISALLLLGFFVLTLLNVWQSDRIEKNQIELLNRIEAVEKTIENGDFGAANGPSGSSGGIFGASEPSYVTEALADSNNIFTRDNANWLPAEASKAEHST